MKTGNSLLRRKYQTDNQHEKANEKAFSCFTAKVENIIARDVGICFAVYAVSMEKNTAQFAKSLVGILNNPETNLKEKNIRIGTNTNIEETKN